MIPKRPSAYPSYLQKPSCTFAILFVVSLTKTWIHNSPSLLLSIQHRLFNDEFRMAHHFRNHIFDDLGAEQTTLTCTDVYLRLWSSMGKMLERTFSQTFHSIIFVPHCLFDDVHRLTTLFRNNFSTTIGVEQTTKTRFSIYCPNVPIKTRNAHSINFPHFCPKSIF